VYNAGEASTPTIAERMVWLSPSAIEPDLSSPFDFTQNIAYDTSRIRTELGHREIVSEEKRRSSDIADRREVIHLCDGKPYHIRGQSYASPDSQVRQTQCKREDTTPKRLAALAISWAAYTPLDDYIRVGGHGCT